MDEYGVQKSVNMWIILITCDVKQHPLDYNGGVIFVVCGVGDEDDEIRKKEGKRKRKRRKGR